MTNFRHQVTIESASEIPTNSASVLLFVLMRCLREPTKIAPFPSVITAMGISSTPMGPRAYIQARDGTEIIPEYEKGDFRSGLRMLVLLLLLLLPPPLPPLLAARPSAMRCLNPSLSLSAPTALSVASRPPVAPDPARCASRSRRFISATTSSRVSFRIISGFQLISGFQALDISISGFPDFFQRRVESSHTPYA